nr:YqcI/YcgG family protein [Bartonella queenslandensis]
MALNLLEGVDANEWRFKVMDTRLYLLVFSPHYPENHARNLPLQDAIAFLIQPNFIFRKFANTQTNLIVPTARKRIRQAYAESGIYYNIPLAESLDHKSKYVKAIDTKKILRLWKIDDEGL